MRADLLEKAVNYEQLLYTDYIRKVGMLNLDAWIILKFILNKRSLIM